MSGHGGRGRGPGWRSLEALRWLARLDVAGIEPLGHALGFSRSATYSHVERLAGAGLVVRAFDPGRERGRDHGGGPARDRRRPGGRARGLDPRRWVRHARAVSWVAALLAPLGLALCAAAHVRCGGRRAATATGSGS